MFVKCCQHFTYILMYEQVIFCKVDVQYKNTFEKKMKKKRD